jgi:very-short-patch-repair endonuclease
MWWLLRSGKFQGYKFRRQQPIGPYIVDFCCLRSKLIIELDGGQHAIHIKQDEVRTEFLEREGFKVVRFWDHEVFKNAEGVLDVILERLNEPPSP